jgi:hypothetical protein
MVKKSSAPSKAKPGSAAVSKRIPVAAPAKPVEAAKPKAKPAPVAPVVMPAKPAVEPKLVRDSYTIPKAEYALLQRLKRRAVDLKRPAKKSEVLRAGVAALGAMDDKALLAALGKIPSLKTGRPKKAAGK